MQKIILEPVLDLLFENEYDLSITATIEGDTVTVLPAANTYTILYTWYGDYIMQYGKPAAGPADQFKLLWTSWIYRMGPNIDKIVAAMLKDYDPTVRKYMKKYFASADQHDTQTETYTPAGTKTEATAHTGSITDSGGKDTGIYGFNSAAAVDQQKETDGNTRTFTNTDTKTDSFTDYSETREKSFENTMTVSTPEGDLTGNKTHADYSETSETDNTAGLICAELDLRFRDVFGDLVRKFADDNFYYVGCVSYDD